VSEFIIFRHQQEPHGKDSYSGILTGSQELSSVIISTSEGPYVTGSANGIWLYHTKRFLLSILQAAQPKLVNKSPNILKGAGFLWSGLLKLMNSVSWMPVFP